jgi:hypothetical protein
MMGRRVSQFTKSDDLSSSDSRDLSVTAMLHPIIRAQWLSLPGHDFFVEEATFATGVTAEVKLCFDLEPLSERIGRSSQNFRLGL